MESQLEEAREIAQPGFLNYIMVLNLDYLHIPAENEPKTYQISGF